MPIVQVTHVHDKPTNNNMCSKTSTHTATQGYMIPENECGQLVASSDSVADLMSLVWPTDYYVTLHAKTIVPS